MEGNDLFLVGTWVEGAGYGLWGREVSGLLALEVVGLLEVETFPVAAAAICHEGAVTFL